MIDPDVRMENKSRFLRYGLFALVVGVAIALWTSQAWAAERSPEIAQGTLPPPPTVQPTPPPTPTPRPDRPDDRDSGQTDPAPPPSTLSIGVDGQQVLTGTVNAPVLNVRQGPSTTSPVVGRLSRGEVVTILARNGDGGWLNICCLPDTQTQGWVSALYITPAYATEQAATLPVRDVAVPTAPSSVTTDVLSGVISAVSLNVRAEPSTSATILGKLGSGTTVRLLAQNDSGDWWLICCLADDGGNGWVASEFVTPRGTAADVAALPVSSGLEVPAVAGASATAETSVAEELVRTSLALAAEVQPAAAIQGDEVVLSFTLTSTGETASSAVELSFEMPSGLSFVSASATDGGDAIQEETEDGVVVVIVSWPELADEMATTVRVRAQIDPDLPDGAVLDGYIVAVADNADSTFAVVSIGMPPMEPPDFQ